MPTAKEQTATMLRDLPEDADFETIQYRLHLLDQIARGEASLGEGGVANDDARRRMARWLDG